MDERTFEEVRRRHQAYVHSRALSLTKNMVDADEIESEVWIKVWGALDRFVGSEENLRAWLSRITQNTFITHWRSKSRSNARSAELTPEVRPALEGGACFSDHGQSDDPCEAVTQMEMFALIEQAFKKINPLYARVLRLFLEGYTYNEIQAAIGIRSLGTVMSRLHRARLQLSAQFILLDIPVPKAWTLAPSNASTPSNAECKGVNAMGHKPGEVDCNDPKNRELVYRRLWDEATPDPGEGGTRSLLDTSPAKLIHKLAHEAGVKISRANGNKLLGKLTNVKLVRQPKGFRIICVQNPYALSASTASASIKGASATETERLLPLDPFAAYRFLYHERGKKNGQGDERYMTTDPHTELLNKRGHNKDAKTAVHEMMARGWADWRSVIGQPESTRRFVLLVDPSTIGNGGDVKHVTPDAPISSVPAPSAAPDSLPTIDPLREARPAAPTSVAAPLTAAPVATTITEPAATVEAEPPPLTLAKRGPHGQKAAYFAKLDELVWKLFCSKASKQERGGWNLASAPVLTFAEIHSATSSVSADAALESIGRFCTADLLLCVAPQSYVLAWNPLDVHTKTCVRRLIVAPRDRIERIDGARGMARRFTHPVTGLIDQTLFVNNVADLWGTTTSFVTNLLFDQASEEAGGSGGSLRLIMRQPDGGGLLLAPNALAGCDLFPWKDETHKRSALVTPDVPDKKDLHKQLTQELRRRFHKAAEYEPWRKREEPVPIVAPTAAPPAAPKPVAPVASSEASAAIVAPPEPIVTPLPVIPPPDPVVIPPELMNPSQSETLVVVPPPSGTPVQMEETATESTDDPLELLRTRQRELNAKQTEMQDKESRIRAEATELRERADATDRLADRVAEQRVELEHQLATLVTQIHEAEQHAQELLDIDRQLAELQAKRAELLRKSTKS